MKTLFLIRHAKSRRDDFSVPDKRRALSKRGKRDASKVGEKLAALDVKPDLILSSPAKRALATARIIARKLGYKAKHIVVDDRLYAASPHELLQVVHDAGSRRKRVMLFGHNPELSELAYSLSGSVTHMPTCSVAEFSFDSKSWRTMGKFGPTNTKFLAPKQR